MIITKDQIRNCIYGAIIGDCLGVPYEFQEKGSFKYKECASGGNHQQKAMTWSDDTSLLLATLNSMHDRVIYIEDTKKHLKLLYKGEYSVDNLLFDIGYYTKRSITSDFRLDTSTSYGNGGLIRLWLPFLLDKEYLLASYGARILRNLDLTHTHHTFYLKGISFYITLLKTILEKNDRKEVLKDYKLHTLQYFQEWYQSLSDLKSIDGTLVNSLYIVIESYLEGKTIGEVISEGGDTDSNAYLYGILLGAENNQEYLSLKSKVRSIKKADKIVERYLETYQE